MSIVDACLDDRAASPTDMLLRISVMLYCSNLELLFGSRRVSTQWILDVETMETEVLKEKLSRLGYILNY